MRNPIHSDRLYPLLITALFALSACASGTPPPGPRCGNGELDSDESCDGSNLNNATCESLGHGTGPLACNNSCGYDTSGCGPTTCGNLIIDPGEECDALNLNGGTCVTLGFDGGAIICSDQCTWDTTACVTLGCGNGLIEAGEECDDGNTAAGDGCNASCTIEAGWSCTGQPSVCSNECGNTIVNTGEDCDGESMGGETCYTLGFSGGILACTGTCRYDTSSCEGDPCGNGTVDTGEDCDGINLNGQGCTTVPGSFTGGPLGCTAGCTFDTSACTTNQCGNSTQETGEDCDDGDLGGASCQSLGFAGGTLDCLGDCTFDESGCSASANCGNGAVEGTEQCDDSNTISGDGCSGGCQWEQDCSATHTINCGGTENESLVIAFNNASLYSCGTLDATGGDHIFSFTPTNSGVASVLLDVANEGILPDNMDLYVLEGACHPELCIQASETQQDDFTSFNVTAGTTYYLAVELETLGFALSGIGEYALTLTCP